MLVVSNLADSNPHFFRLFPRSSQPIPPMPQSEYLYRNYILKTCFQDWKDSQTYPLSLPCLLRISIAGKQNEMP